jgi:UDP-glucose 4-epimerase
MKSVTTQFVKNYGKWYGLKYSICYFYNVYGPYHDTCNTGWETVISIFEKQWKAKKGLTIVGDGTQKRDFTYVGDIVNGLILASEKLENDEYQLGSGQDYSILEVADLFGGEKEFIEARPGDRKYGLANVEETFRKLNWRPQMNLKDWINNVKNNYNEKN